MEFSNLDWDTLFGGDWNFENTKKNYPHQWKEWIGKFVVLDLALVNGCNALQPPT